MQDAGLHRLKGLTKTRRYHGRPKIVPYEKYTTAKYQKHKCLKMNYFRSPYSNI